MLLTVRRGGIIMLKMNFVGVNDWSQPVYKDDKGRQWIDLNCGENNPDLHRSTDDEFLDGEPNYRIDCEYEFVNQYKESPQRFQYMMLSRLQSDCDFYIGYGKRNIKRLCGDSIDEHIKEMKSLWTELNEKPEWLTWDYY